MTPLQQQTNNVINAMQEGTVGAVITLYDAGLIDQTYFKSNFDSDDRRRNIGYILTNFFRVSVSDAEYWLDWFGIKSNV